MVSQEDPNIFEVPDEYIDVQIVEAPKPKPKKKRVMSEAQRVQALENLKKGRETARKNRLKKQSMKMDGLEESNVSMTLEKEPAKKEAPVRDFGMESELKALRDEIYKMRSANLERERKETLQSMKRELEELKKQQKVQNEIKKEDPKPEPKPEPVKEAPKPVQQEFKPPPRVTQSLFSKAPW